MRLRFSLRTLFLLTTIVAALCLWFLLPSLTARRFLAALASEDYKAADAVFRNANDRFFQDWSDQHWSVRSYGELPTFTFDQLWRCKRDVRVEITYFELDQNFSLKTSIVATTFGLNKPDVFQKDRVGVLIDDRGGRATPIR